MQKTLEELKAAAEKAMREYELAKKAAREEGLSEVRALIQEFGFSQDELFKIKSPRVLRSEKPLKNLAGVAYEKHGMKWGGKGCPPLWVIGARENGTLDKYKIEPASAS